MRDYYCSYSDGRNVLISQMTDAELADAISDIGDDEVGGTQATREAIRERLLLERFIRESGLNHT